MGIELPGLKVATPAKPRPHSSQRLKKELGAALRGGGAGTGRLPAVVAAYSWACVLVGCAAALGYWTALGRLGSDTFLGFWGTAILMLIPLLVAARLVDGCSCLPATEGKLVAVELLLFGAIYPCLAALDANRETLYLNVSAFIFLAIAAWMIAQRTGNPAASVASHDNHAVVST